MSSNISPMRKRKNWNPDAMRQAIEAIKSGQMGYLKASRHFSVPRSTLEYYYKKDGKIEEIIKTTLGRKPVFTAKVEEELVDYCLEMEKRFYGLTAVDVRRIAYQLAIANGIPNPFPKEKAAAGKKWLRKFIGRNSQLSFRKPQGVSAARVKGFTAENVQRFFEILEPELGKINFNPSRIYNVDETGVTSVQHKNSKIVSLKGKKQIGALTTAERGSLVTLVMCMNAAGGFVPPMLIFPRKNFKAELMDGAPPGSIGKCHPSGWIQSYLFTQWLDHFISHTKPSENDPIVLILDGHYSHTRNVDVINKARENSITIICLPPHSSHKLQPLDLAFMAPFKHYYAKEIEAWLKNHPGRTVTSYQIAGLVGKAYVRAASMEVSINGFKKCGILPFNSNIFRDCDFAIHEKMEVVEEEGKSNQDSTNGDGQNGTPATTDTSTNKTFRKPADLCPLPSVAGPSGLGGKRKRRSGKAELISGSPYKNDLEEQLQQSRAKELKKTVGKQRRQLVKPEEKTHVAMKKVNKTDPTTNKRNKKHKKPAVSSSSSSDEESIRYIDTDDEMDPNSDEDDVECLFCQEPFSADCKGEVWIKCHSCYKWAHEACASVDKSKQYICDFCIDG